MRATSTRRDVEHVRGEPRGDERANELARRDQHLAAEVAALLLRRQLILEVHACGAGFDHRLHQLERVERRRRTRPPHRRRSARASTCRSALRRESIWSARSRALLMRLHERRHAVRRIEALVGVRVPGEVRVGCDLPAGQIDRLQAGLDHLHGLVAGQRAERRDVLLVVQELPQPLGAELRERVLDREAPRIRSTRPRVRPLDPVQRPFSSPPLISRLLPRSCARNSIWILNTANLIRQTPIGADIASSRGPDWIWTAACSE